MGGGWIQENLQFIMMGIGLASAIGVVFIFGIYFVVKRKVRKNR